MRLPLASYQVWSGADDPRPQPGMVMQHAVSMRPVSTVSVMVRDLRMGQPLMARTMMTATARITAATTMPTAVFPLPSSSSM